MGVNDGVSLSKKWVETLSKLKKTYGLEKWQLLVLKEISQTRQSRSPKEISVHGEKHPLSSTKRWNMGCCTPKNLETIGSLPRRNIAVILVRSGPPLFRVRGFPLVRNKCIQGSPGSLGKQVRTVLRSDSVQK
jgi:hypothetical protein